MANEKWLIDAGVWDERDVNIIVALAEKRMNVTEVSRAVFMHRNSVVYHIEKIKRITGLNPLDFYDLHRLLQMLKKEDVRLEEKQATSDKTSEENERWIPVTERLPENFVSVLGYMTDAGDFPPVRECYTVGNSFFFPALGDIHPVSHWREMPQLQKEV